MRNGESGAMAAGGGGATAQPRNLPGINAVDQQLGGVMALPIAAIFTGLAVWQGLSTGDGGHLAPPVLQWIFGTPVGVVAVAALGSVVLSVLPALEYAWLVQRHRLVWAVDVTGAPADVWSARRREHLRGRYIERLLGRNVRARAISLVLLAAAAVALVLAIWGLLDAFSYSDRVRDLSNVATCLAQRCPPDYDTLLIGAVYMSACVGLICFTAARWLHRAQLACGIWLRGRRSFWSFALAPYYYVRQPGVSAEAAVEAIASVAPAARPSLARVYALYILALLPLWLAVIGSELLGGWLRLHWLPG